MKDNRLQLLLKLLVDNKINARELDELAALLAQPDGEQHIDAQMKATWAHLIATNESHEELYHKITGHPRFSAALAEKPVSLRRRRALLGPWHYAAATILLCCGIGLGSYYYQSENADGKMSTNRHHTARQNDTAMPAESHVTLRLSNGEQLVLDEANVGKVGQDDHVNIFKNKAGELVYDLSRMEVNGEIAYNSISTPVGSHYQLVLSDGTKVWLNAKSSLRFPAAFKGSERKVELSGEAYFEVVSNKNKPFIVNAKAMDVKVLGTHFNVSAYDDDAFIETSLLEGSVVATHQGTSLLLTPGQQAYLKGSSGQIGRRSFDADEVMDWKNGYFIFRNEPIDEIMKKIGRWYNIEVAYQGKMTREAFGGKYSKSNSLKELLSSLELTGMVRFKVEGRRVTVVL